MKIKIEDLKKQYGDKVVLDIKGLEIESGKITGVTVANGCGKTTLLNILSGRLANDSGDFFVSNNTNIGYLRQSDNFESEKTVYEEMLAIFSEVIPACISLSTCSTMHRSFALRI